MTFFLPLLLPSCTHTDSAFLSTFALTFFFFLSLFSFSLYILRGKERYTAIFTRMLTEGGHHLCKLSEIVTSSLPSLPSERKPQFQIIQRILLPATLTTMLPLTAPLHMIGVFQSKHASLLLERASLIKQTSCLRFEDFTSQHQEL